MKTTSLLFAATLLATPAFAQDECATAVALPDGIPTAYDTLTASPSLPAWPCALGGAADVWFTFTTTQAADVDVSTCNDATYDTAIEIFTGDCNNLTSLICNDDGPGCAGFSSIASVTGLAAGTNLFIRVGGWQGATGAGNVTLTETADPCAGTPNDVFEDNNDCGTATPAVDGSASGLILTEGDFDFFTFSLAAGGTVTADILFAQADGDMDAYLWDPAVACDSRIEGQGTTANVLDVGFSVDDNEFLTYTNATGAAQQIVLEVRHWSGSGPNGCSRTYGITLDGVGMASPGPIGSNYCPQEVNATGLVGTMSAFGLTSIAANDITLTASDLPVNQFGIFTASDTQGFVPMAGGASNGNLCLGGQIGRYQGAGQILSSGGTGSFSLPINVNAIPQGGGILAVSAGTVVYFQSWHRELPGVGSNFTDGLEITLSN